MPFPTPQDDTYLEMVMHGLVTHAEFSGPDELVLTFSPRRRVLLRVIDGDLAIAEEHIPTC